MIPHGTSIKWTPVTEELPPKNSLEMYLTISAEGFISTMSFDGHSQEFEDSDGRTWDTVAWAKPGNVVTTR